MRRWTTRIVLSLLLLGDLLLLAVLSFRGQSIVEELNDPVAVEAVNSDALVLEDGRRVILPGFQELRADSPGLKEAVRPGVEIAEDGRVWGQVRVHHWCGNDPIGLHLKRVDLSSFVAYLEEIRRFDPEWEGFAFRERGWRAGWDMDFDRWQKTGRSILLSWRQEDEVIEKGEAGVADPL